MVPLLGGAALGGLIVYIDKYHCVNESIRTLQNTMYHFLKFLDLTVECLTVTLRYKQQVTFLNKKFD